MRRVPCYPRGWRARPRTRIASAVRTNKSYSRVRRDFLNVAAVTEIASAKENASCYSENVLLLLLWRRRRRVVEPSGGDGACDFIDVVVARRVSPRGHWPPRRSRALDDITASPTAMARMVIIVYVRVIIIVKERERKKIKSRKKQTQTSARPLLRSRCFSFFFFFLVISRARRRPIAAAVSNFPPIRRPMVGYTVDTAGRASDLPPRTIPCETSVRARRQQLAALRPRPSVGPTVTFWVVVSAGIFSGRFFFFFFLNIQIIHAFPSRSRQSFFFRFPFVFPPRTGRNSRSKSERRTHDLFAQRRTHVAITSDATPRIAVIVVTEVHECRTRSSLFIINVITAQVSLIRYGRLLPLRCTLDDDDGGGCYCRHYSTRFVRHLNV